MEMNAQPLMNAPEFVIGDRVHVQTAGGAHTHIIEGPRQYPNGWEYRITALDGAPGEPAWEAEHQLTRCDEGHAGWRSPDEFRRDLLLAKLRLRLTDTLYTYRASRTIFEPYQFRPVLRFLASQQQRLLIADEVGLGKTIEAAMIYLELKARLGSELKRVLIVCPSRLRKKWQDELSSRFDEEFSELQSVQDVRHLLHRWRELGDAHRFRCIVSYELLRSESLAREWVERGVRLDLLIADEAHVMRNPSSLTHSLGDILTDHADAAVFLTATPLMLGEPDLFNLLRLLSPEDYPDFTSFPEQIRPNAFINEAARAIGDGQARQALDRLRFVEMTIVRQRFLSDPRYADVVARLRSLSDGVQPLSLDDRVRLQRQILELNTLSAIFTRTRKREVASAKPRQAFTMTVTLSPAERAFYDAFLAQVRRDVMQANGGAAAFAVVMRERMAASCLAAARETIRKSFEQHRAVSLEIERSAFHLAEEDADEQQANAERLRSTGQLLELSRAIGDADAKFDLFEQTLRTRLAQSEKSKALVFSYFRGTLQYLLNRLTNLGYQVGVIHGGIPIQDRQKVIEKFRDDPRQRILLSSEVGAEGLDFQFCDVLVNFDLPWNPMQVEQRIGRLDRFGQEADQIHIYNFVLEDTIETRIFERLYHRINIFERSIGDLEAILGREIRELSLDVIRAALTPEQEIARAEAAAQSIIARQQATEELERQQDQLVGQGAILDAAVNATVDGGHVVHPQEIEALVRTFLQTAIDPPPSFERDDVEDCWLLRINPPLGERLRRYTQDEQDGGGATDRFRKAVAELKPIAVTFDADLARQRPLLELITARHALASVARAYWEEHTRCLLPASRVEISGVIEEAGDGHLFIYALVEEGLGRQARLQAVVVLDDGRLAPQAAESVLRQIATAERPITPIPAGHVAMTHVQKQADALIALDRDRIQQERTQRHVAVVAARRAAIETSFAAKEQSILAALAATTNAAAKQMNQGRLHHLRARRAEKLEELDKSVFVRVHSQLVAAGRIRIMPVLLTADLPEHVVVSVPQTETLPEGSSVSGAALSDGCTRTDEAVWPTECDAADAEVTEIQLTQDDLAETVADDEHADDVQEPVLVLTHPPSDLSVAQGTEDDPAIEDAQHDVATTADFPAPVSAPACPAATDASDGLRAELADDTPVGVVAPPDPSVEGTNSRPLQFPDDESVGLLLIRNANTGGTWEPFGQARGTVQVPLCAEVCLHVTQAATSDLHWLTSLGPTDLFSLVLDHSGISGNDLVHVSWLNGLRELSLSDTEIGDQALRTLQRLPELTAISLAGTLVTGLGMMYLKPLAQLQRLDVSRTSVSGDGLIHLAGASELEDLCLADTSVGDGAMVHVRRLTALRRLDLRGTAVTDTGRRRIPDHIDLLTTT